MLRDLLRPCVFVTLLAAGANLVLLRVGDTTLLDGSVVTGWSLGLALVLVTRPWWAPGTVSEREALRVRLNLWLPAFLALAYVGHAGVRWPAGWAERALLVLLAAALVGALVGRRLQRAGAEEDAVRRWLLVQTAIGASLVTLSVIHGVFVHAHGLLAHLFL